MATFNPFDLDKPVLQLGDFGEFVLGDITESRHKRLAEIGELIATMDDTDDGLAGFAKLIGDLAEAACENADGLSAHIVGLVESDTIGAKALQHLAEFIHDWVAGQESAGEG